MVGMYYNVLIGPYKQMPNYFSSESFQITPGFNICVLLLKTDSVQHGLLIKNATLPDILRT